MAAKTLPDVDTLRQFLDYDPATGLFVWKDRPEETFANRKAWLRWKTLFVGRPALILTETCGYKVGRINGEKYKAHRVAWKMFYGTEPSEIDHINGDRSDNRISNLREVSRVENSRNKRIHPANSSGVTGVVFHKATKKWLAKIGIGMSAKHLGLFETFDEAVAARKAAEAEHGFHENHGRAA